MNRVDKSSPTTQISPDTLWPGRLYALLAEYLDIPRPPMGCPNDWQIRLESLKAADSRGRQP